MQKLSKKLLTASALVLSLAIVINMCVIGSVSVTATTDTYDITERINTTLTHSLEWLNSSQNENGSWGDEQIINDTCYSISALNSNGYDTSAGLSWLDSLTVAKNNDTISHKIFATSNTSYAKDLIAMQNKDGGFGIHKNYSSDVYDSVLAFEALTSLNTTDYNKNIQSILSYFINSQNTDGSYSINGYNDPDKALSARVAYNMLKYLNDNKLTSTEVLNSIAAATSFLSGTNVTDMSESNIESTIYYCLLKNQQGDYTNVYDIVKAIADAQSEDGSFYGSVYNTYLVIKYLNEIDTIDNNYSVDTLAVDLSEDSIIVNTPTEITGSYTIAYNTATDKNFTMLTTVYDGEDAVYTQEASVALAKNEKTVKDTAITYTVDEKEAKVLKVVSVLMDGETELKTYTNFIYVNEKPIEPKTELTDAGIRLSDNSGYTGETKTITASYYMLYTTNVNYAIDVKTAVYCDKALVSKNEHQAILTPDAVSVENNTVELELTSDEAKVYEFVTEFYDGETLLATRTDYYTIYEHPSDDGPVDPDNPKMVNTITQFSVNLDNYFMYASNIKKEIIANCNLLYSFDEDCDITVKGYVMDGEKVLKSNEQTVSISKEASSLNFELIKISDLDISEEKQYIFKAKIYDVNGDYVGERTAELNIKVRPKVSLTLTADTKTGKDYNVNLAWNDISSTAEQYGYRILRSGDDGKTWETRSSWSGSETVRVLNIYPISNAESYLTDWMNRKISGTNETAGKGLFEIDTVYISDYNSNPDYYLKDDNGEYKYDVLFFGTYDSNNGRDLNDMSQKATQSFIDNGGGVLFGHDTIADAGSYINNHPYFNKFTEQVGIATGIYYYNPTTKADVVLNGFLTSFPWTISGTLDIPATHCLSQYAGGNLEGTVWIKLKNSSVNTLENGATNDFYLVTNNQLAMIQTGHSNGQATDDECKVIANTLFYLKQLTSNTSVRDNSFYDEAAPEKPSVDITLSEYNKNSYGLNFDISSKDFGTTYKYRAEAIPKSNSSENVLSNTVVSEAFSDLKGFVVLETNSADSALEKIKYEEDGTTILDVIPATDGKITYNMNDLKKNKKYYLHIFAVDNENNISEEYIKEIYDNEEVISQADINSTLTCDKSLYLPDEGAKLTATAYTTGTSLNATADIQLCDLNGNVISTVTNDIKTQLSSVAKWSEEYSCSLSGLTAGRYMAIITWYVADVPVAQSQCMIKIGEPSEADSITLKSDVKQGADYSNTLNWNDINEDSEDIDIPTDFSIVVDVSGSMSGERIVNARKAIDKFIDMLSVGDRISIVKFASSASLVCDFTDDKTILKDCVSKLSYGGGTSVSSGLNMSINTFATDNNTAENYNKVVILICDGDVNNCNSAVNSAIENNISINTVNVVNANVTALQNISSQTGGTYYYSNVVSDMTEILQNINIMNHGGEYYYQVQRDSEIIDAVTNTEYVDTNFVDTASPEFSSVDFTATTLQENTYNGYIKATANDVGTDYKYQIRGVNKTDETDVVYSNTEYTTALSGLKGYAFKIDTSPDAVPEILNDEACFVSTDSELKVDVTDCQRGTVYYLHIYAIDNAGNRSNEKLYPFVVGNPMFSGVSITTDITTDKKSYTIGENAYLDVTAKASFYKTFAKGVVEIYDTNNTLVDTVESDYIAEITSYEDLTNRFVWNVKSVSAGDYVASIKWYDGSKLLASDTANFTVEPDGDITDKVTTDKLQYTTAEDIKVSDNIFNNTTNTYENNLELDIDIINSADEKVITTISTKVSSVAGGTSTYSDYLKAQNLGIGNYTAVSRLKNKDDIITSSSAQFSVIDFTELNQKYSGIITVSDNSDKDKKFNYSVTNTGNQDGKDLLIKANVYSIEGELLGTIEKTTDINKGETVEFSELFNTEPLKIGSYPVSLTITTNDGKEAVLANSGFEINMINKYTVKFVNDDGTVLDTQSVEYGSSAKAPKAPTKAADKQYTYEFAGWDTDFTKITGDTTVTAKYTSTVNKYTVTFVNYDGTVLDKQSVEYGSSAKAPKAPTKAADKQYTYEFAGWDTDFTKIIGDTTVTAKYTAKELPTEPKVEPTEAPTEPITQSVTDPTNATQKPTEAPTARVTSPATQAPTTFNTEKSVVTTGASGTLFTLLLPLLGGFVLSTILFGKSKRQSEKKKEG